MHSFVYLDAVVVILMLEGSAHFGGAVREIDQICRIASRLLEINVTAGIGQLVKNLEDMSVSYKGAMDAADYRVLLEPNKIRFQIHFIRTVHLLNAFISNPSLQ
mgnify:CR=1 FL=1